MNPFYGTPGITRRKAFVDALLKANKWGIRFCVVKDLQTPGEYHAFGATDVIPKLDKTRYRPIARTVPHPTAPMLHRLELITESHS